MKKQILMVVIATLITQQIQLSRAYGVRSLQLQRVRISFPRETHATRTNDRVETVLKTRRTNDEHEGAASIARFALLSDSSSLLSPFEIYCVEEMEDWYRRALSLKCPFLRRRASDFLDGADMILRFLVIRHKSLDLLGPPPGWRCEEGRTCFKLKNVPIQDLIEIIRNDWRVDSNKGYYITGRLNTTVYRDDCLFDGPDPDMPVRGLRKYLNAASQLFDQGKSRSKLLSLEIVDDDKIMAKWEMNGILRLPWRPELPTWTGTTTYHFDEDGLIYLHKETWDMSVLQAFLRTFWPSLARKIWCNKASIDDEECLVSYEYD